MKNKWLVLRVSLTVLLAAGLGYCYASGRLSFFVFNAHARIEVNGTPVQGRMFQGRSTSIVTTRQEGKDHSYQLFFEGDTDFTGDMGFVIDCGSWIAPRLPLLPETRNYPPCKKWAGDVPRARRWSLIDKGKYMEFVLKNQSKVRITR